MGRVLVWLGWVGLGLWLGRRMLGGGLRGAVVLQDGGVVGRRIGGAVVLVTVLVMCTLLGW